MRVPTFWARVAVRTCTIALIPACIFGFAALSFLVSTVSSMTTGCMYVLSVLYRSRSTEYYLCRILGLPVRVQCCTVLGVPWYVHCTCTCTTVLLPLVAMRCGGGVLALGIHMCNFADEYIGGCISRLFVPEYDMNGHFTSRAFPFFGLLTKNSRQQHPPHRRWCRLYKTATGIIVRTVL